MWAFKKLLHYIVLCVFLQGDGESDDDGMDDDDSLSDWNLSMLHISQHMAFGCFSHN